MLVVREFEIDCGSQTPHSLLEKLLGGVAGAPRIWVYFEDRLDLKTSGVQQALKRFPALATLGPPPVEGGKRTRLASLPDRPDAAERWEAPLDRAFALDVAREVVMWKLRHAHFVVGPLPELWLAGAELPARPRALDWRSGYDESPASVAVIFSVGPGGKHVAIRTSVVLPAPPREARKLPPLPALLGQLGKPDKERQLLVAEAEESEARRDAEPAAELLVRGYDLAAVAVPHPELTDDPSGDGAFGSFMDELKRVLPGYRYRPTGTRGVWRLTRRTAADNELVFSVDRGPMGGNASASLTIRGPMWSQYWSLQRLRVWNPTTLAKLCANWGAVVAALERDLIPELERLYWRGFAWYSPD